MINIRHYKQSDSSMLNNWWVVQSQSPPIPEALSEDCTFIFELDGLAAMSVSIYLTQNKQVSLLEAYVKNPIMKKVLTREHSQLFLDHVLSFAKDKGYKRTILICPVEKLKPIYQSFGWAPVANNITSFVKEL